jgi:hypothetical protein
MSVVVVEEKMFCENSKSKNKRGKPIRLTELAKHTAATVGHAVFCHSQMERSQKPVTAGYR